MEPENLLDAMLATTFSFSLVYAKLIQFVPPPHTLY